MSVLQTVQKNNRQFTYGQTVQKNNRQFTYGQTVQKNNKQFTYGQTVQKNNRQFTYGQTVQKKQQTIYIWTDSAKNCTGAFTVLQTVQKSNSNLHMDSRAVRLIEIEIKSRFELARFLNRFIARFFLRPCPNLMQYAIRTNQNAAEQNRPGIETDSVLKKQGR